MEEWIIMKAENNRQLRTVDHVVQFTRRLARTFSRFRGGSFEKKNAPLRSYGSLCAPREIDRGILSEMICDTRTCGECQYLEQDEPDDRTASLAEFLANCQHAKCKVVRLVRQQISKLQNVQHERFLTVSDVNDGAREWMHETPTKINKIKYESPDNNEVHEVYGEVYEMEGRVVQRASNNELYGKPYETQQVAARRIDEVTNANASATASLHRAASPGRAVDRKWMLRILDRVRHRAHLILAAAAVGVIVWTALVYGVFLGATACGSGRTCFRSSLRYTHAKRTLF